MSKQNLERSLFRWVHFKLGINLFAQISILLHFFATVNPREYSLYYTGSMTHRVSITHRSDKLHFDQSLSDLMVQARDFGDKIFLVMTFTDVGDKVNT